MNTYIVFYEVTIIDGNEIIYSTITEQTEN